MNNISPPKNKFNVLLDCANGATSEIVGRILKYTFINLIPINNEPSSKNINENCGATNTKSW